MLIKKLAGFSTIDALIAVLMLGFVITSVNQVLLVKFRRLHRGRENLEHFRSLRKIIEDKALLAAGSKDGFLEIKDGSETVVIKKVVGPETETLKDFDDRLILFQALAVSDDTKTKEVSSFKNTEMPLYFLAFGEKKRES